MELNALVGADVREGALDITTGNVVDAFMDPTVDVSVLSTVVLVLSVVVAYGALLAEEDDGVCLDDVSVPSPDVIFCVCCSVEDVGSAVVVVC